MKIDEVAFPHSMSAHALKAARKAIEQARFGTNTVMEQLRIESGSAAVQKEISADLSANKDVLLTCAKAANKSLKSSKRQSPESCLEVADSPSFAKPLSEIVTVYPKPKSRGGVWMIWHDGPSQEA